MLRALERAALIPPQEEREKHELFPSTSLGRSLRHRHIGGFPACILQRASGQQSSGSAAMSRNMFSCVLPCKYVSTESIADRAYSVRFSAGGMLAAASQSGSIRVFNVEASGLLKPYARIEPRGVQWAITHVDWLGENKILYSSMHNVIHLAKLPVDGSGSTPSTQTTLSLHTQISVYAFAVAPGGVELTAATSDGNIVIYDIEAGRVSETFVAHRDDINSVCYAATGGEGADIIVTGSDDGLIKVFDRRAARGSGAAAAASVLVGHRAGITCVAARGDNRYIASNGKDQTCRIFDIRKAVPARDWDAESFNLAYAFDYRWREPRLAMFNSAQAGDASVATLRGHVVLRTLIRAAWSPLASTGGRFIASGSAEGGVHLWDLLDVCGGDPNSIEAKQHLPTSASESTINRPTSGPFSGLPHTVIRFSDDRVDLVRDVSWHPRLPLLASTSWAPGAVCISAYDDVTRVLARTSRQILSAKRTFALLRPEDTGTTSLVESTTAQSDSSDSEDDADNEEEDDEEEEEGNDDDAEFDEEGDDAELDESADEDEDM